MFHDHAAARSLLPRLMRLLFKSAASTVRRDSYTRSTAPPSIPVLAFGFQMYLFEFFDDIGATLAALEEGADAATAAEEEQ